MKEIIGFQKDLQTIIDSGDGYKDSDGEYLNSLDEIMALFEQQVSDAFDDFRQMDMEQTLQEMLTFISSWKKTNKLVQYSTSIEPKDPNLDYEFESFVGMKGTIVKWLDCVKGNVLFQDQPVFLIEFFSKNVKPKFEILLYE